MTRLLWRFSIAAAIILLGSDMTAGFAAAGEPERDAGKIQWHEWGPEPFCEAGARDQLVLLDVGMEGCTACRWMDEDTYRDPEVISLMSEHFVAVQVDSESRPDIGERYAAWGWPATIIMKPNGDEVLRVRGNKRPRNFIPILEEVLRAKRSGELKALPRSALETKLTSVTTDEETLRNELRQRMDRIYGASATPPRVTIPSLTPLVYYALRGAVDENSAGTQMIENRLNRMLGLIDREAGGVFVARLKDRIIREKRTGAQANALYAFADAYHRTRDPKWLDAATQIDRYLRGPMQHEDGTFYTSQEDLIPGLPASMDADDYYQLSQQERAAYGEPVTDHAVHTDLNARVIHAYLRLYRVTLNKEYLDVAVRAAETLLADRWREPGFIVQSVSTKRSQHDDRIRPLAQTNVLFLRTSAEFGLALLSLSEATTHPKWRELARALAGTMREQLEDKGRGGFYMVPESRASTPLHRRKPFADNALAARFLLMLGGIDDDATLREVAARTIRLLAAPAALREAGTEALELAITTELWAIGPIQITVVKAGKPRADRALHRASYAIYDPRVVVELEAPGKYPRSDEPTAFVCSPSFCSSPLRGEGAIRAYLAGL